MDSSRQPCGPMYTPEPAFPHIVDLAPRRTPNPNTIHHPGGDEGPESDEEIEKDRNAFPAYGAQCTGDIR